MNISVSINISLQASQGSSTSCESEIQLVSRRNFLIHGDLLNSLDIYTPPNKPNGPKFKICTKILFLFPPKTH